MINCHQPFSWIVGTAKPIVNEYSWTNLSSLLYVEQPVGTGMSQCMLARKHLLK
jgi:carboxypeptidase C (cathepsin A)